MDIVNRKQEAFDRISSASEALSAFGVLRIGLFGSFVRDEALPHSDIDLFVELDPNKKTLKNMVGLATFLHGLLGRKVELVTPQSLNRFIGPHITPTVEYVPLAA